MRNHTPLAYLTEVCQTHAHPIKEAIIIPIPAPPTADIIAIAFASLTLIRTSYHPLSDISISVLIPSSFVHMLLGGLLDEVCFSGT